MRETPLGQIECQNASKRVGNRTLFANLHFTLRPGECLGLIGPNGAGKTSILRSLLGIYRIDDGDIRLNGVSVRDPRFSEELRHLSVVLDNPGLYRSLNAWENLAFFDRIRFPKAKAKEREARIEKALHEFGLYEHRLEAITFFSKGMKQRLALARAFLSAPQFFILDEPFQGLDVDGSMMLRESLTRAAHEQTGILLSAHDLFILYKLCDRFLFLKSGRAVKSLSKEELRQEMGARIYECEEDDLPPKAVPLQRAGGKLIFYSEIEPERYQRRLPLEEVDIELYYKGVMGWEP